MKVIVDADACPRGCPEAVLRKSRAAGAAVTTAANFSVTNAGGNVACASLAASILGLRVGRVEFNVATGLTAGQACEGLASSTSSILFTGCEVP